MTRLLFALLGIIVLAVASLLALVWLAGQLLPGSGRVSWWARQVCWGGCCGIWPLQACWQASCFLWRVRGGPPHIALRFRRRCRYGPPKVPEPDPSKPRDLTSGQLRPIPAKSLRRPQKPWVPTHHRAAPSRATQNRTDPGPFF